MNKWALVTAQNRFGISFYVLNAKGEHAAVSMFTGSNYAVCTENGPQTLACDGLITRPPGPSSGHD